MAKEARIYNGEKAVSLISGTGKTGQQHAKQWDYNSPSYCIWKLIQNGLKTSM